jgi:hypothetical protein
MKPRPALVIPPPSVLRLPDGRYYASSRRFPDLWAIERTAEAAGFVFRMLVQKRLYGQAWRWAATAADSEAIGADGVPF